MSPEDDKATYLETGTGDVPDRDRLDQIRNALTSADIWAEPPQSALDGVLSAIRSESGSPRSEPERVRALTRWPAAVAAVAVAAAMVALVIASAMTLSRNDEEVIAMEGTDLMPAAAGTASLRPTDSGWWIRLDLDGISPAATGTYYEGWVWSDDGEGVSIGTFHMRGGPGSVTLWSGVDVGEYPSIWVTIQDEGAGPSPSDLVVMKGRWDQAGG